MAKSKYIFESGEGIDVGSHGEHDYVFSQGSPVADTGKSAYVFESGTGIGGESAKITISDSFGEEEADVNIIERSESIEEYYNYGETDAAAEGQIQEYTKLRYTTFLIFKNGNTDEYSFGFVHDTYRPDNSDCGGDIDIEMDGLPDGANMVVRDDDPGNDTYYWSPPTGTAEHIWGGVNTDGLMIGKFTASELSGVTVTFDVVKHQTNSGYVPETIRFAGDDGTTIERDYDDTYTTITMDFGDNFGGDS